MSVVTGIRRGVSNRGWIFANAVLDCGHLAPVQLVPTRYRCVGCGAETTTSTPCGACGRQCFDILYRPSESKDSDIVTRAGDVVECKRCPIDAEMRDKMRAALLSPDLSHTRYRNGSVYAYRFDASSPTGVLVAAGCPETIYRSLEAELRGRVHGGSLSPLSPTERR